LLMHLLNPQRAAGWRYLPTKIEKPPKERKMQVFGQNRPIRLAVFEQGHMPTIKNLKKIFSSSSVKTYKGWGHFRSELYTLNHALRVVADLRGTAHDFSPTSCEVVVLDDTAQYTVFTAAKYFGYLKATINWSPTLYDRLRDLLSALGAVSHDQRLCEFFLRSVERLKEQYKSQGISDSHLEAFDPQVFQSAYGQFGQQGFLELRQRIADELSNMHWTADNPVYESAANDDQKPEARAA
jgi:hypothetical protein